MTSSSDAFAALVQKGQIELMNNRLEQAQDVFLEALQLCPQDGAVHFQLASIAETRGDLKTAEIHYRQVLAVQPENRQAYIQLAFVLYHNKQLSEAFNVLRQASVYFPEDREILNLRSQLVRKNIPGWHLPMLADARRNDAYEQAINETVTSEDIVLEIGTGSGLLAMMAARAGAKHVYACESDEILASLAREVIAANGLSDKITVLHKHSSLLVVGLDLPQKATVLVTEIFDRAFVGEGALPTLVHAQRFLLADNVKMIPQKAILYGALFECPSFRHFQQAGTVNGFDLSLMNSISHPLSYTESLYNLDEESEQRVLSESFVIQDFDFHESIHTEFSNYADVSVIESGNVDGVIMWFDLVLSPNVTFSTRHAQRNDHWRQAAQIFIGQEAIQAQTSKHLYVKYKEFFDFSFLSEYED